jgi:hypothetical protein
MTICSNFNCFVAADVPVGRLRDSNNLIDNERIRYE